MIKLDRLQIQHGYVMVLVGGHIIAPMEIKLKSGRNCKFLDIGCGRGNWCMEVANKYPNVTVLGIDIVSIFPEAGLPENCSFEIVDASKWPMPFDDNTYDLINIHSFGLVLQTTQYDAFFSEIMRLLKPGGYLQWIEFDMENWRCGPTITELWLGFRKMMELRNLEPYLARKYEKMAKKCGFVNIKHTFVSLPKGEWAGPLGETSIKVMREAFTSLAVMYCSVYGWRVEDFYIKVEKGLAEMNEGKSYQNIHSLICGKPLLI